MPQKRYEVIQDEDDEGNIISKKVRVPLEFADGVSTDVARTLADARQHDARERIARHRPGPRVAPRSQAQDERVDERAKAYDEAGAWMRDAWRTPFVEPSRPKPAQRQQTGDARAAAFREQGERLRTAWRGGA
jgi:hypothetical protein